VVVAIIDAEIEHAFNEEKVQTAQTLETATVEPGKKTSPLNLRNALN